MSIYTSADKIIDEVKESVKAMYLKLSLLLTEDNLEYSEEYQNKLMETVQDLLKIKKRL